ncbi:MAG: alpha/beta hydrolase, partial [Pseudomonadota bacterium]
HGRSSAASDGHNYRQHGDDLAEVLDLLGLHQVVLVGWSLGVYDALSYLQAHGNEGVLGLVLVDESPQIIRSDGNAWGEGTEEEVAGLIGLVRSSFLGFFRDYMVSGFVEPPPSDVVERFVDAAKTLTATQAADLLKDATRYDFTEQLKSLDDVLPILHILREDWSVQATRWIEQNQPSANHFTLGNHLMLMEFPDQFSHRVTQFVDSVGA